MTAGTDSSAVATLRRADGFTRAAAVLWAAFAAFTLMVGLGLVDGTDRRLAELGRPDAVWEPRQQAFSHVTSWLSPLHVATAWRSSP